MKFYVVPRKEVESVIARKPIPAAFLRDWLALRPGALDDDKIDIFCKSPRSANQRWTAFDLFERVETPQPGAVVVLPCWLELCEACDLPENIETLVRHTLAKYPHNPVVFQWNNDKDAWAVNAFHSLPPRAFVVQFGTSRPTPNDILVPFWNINTRAPTKRRKKFDAGFIGYVGSIKPRRLLEMAVHRRQGVYWKTDRIPESDYLRLMSMFRFSFAPRGGGLSSYRFFEAIQCCSVPILIADNYVTPYPDLDYEEFSLRLSETRCVEWSVIEEWIRMPEHRYEAMVNRLDSLRERFSLAGVQREVHGRLEAYLQ